MAGINNIIGAYIMNPKRVSSKLSFELGQVFAAKIVSSDEMNKELILKLLDGWQFPAKLQAPLDLIPEGLVKFQVEGFQNGKLQIKLISSKEEKQELNKSSLEDLISDGKVDVNKDDYNILNRMIKHNMPLTKDNISKVKTLVEFREKLFKSEDEAYSFILKYVNSKNIDVNSAKGKEISETLKGFFNELKNISEDELLTMLENNIDINEDNIKSFIKIFREESSIYKVLKETSEKLDLEVNAEPNEISSETGGKDIANNKVKQNDFKENKAKNYSIDWIIEQELQNSNMTSEEKEVYKGLKRLMESESNENSIIEEEPASTKLRGVSHKEVEGGPQEKLSVNADIAKEKIKFTQNRAKELTKPDKSFLLSEIKEQITNKTEDMKNIIRNLLSEDKGQETESFGKVIYALKENINDFKIFNSVSNQYYYLDVPVNVNREEYQCKLLIKDDRKSGKKIDSKNVSLVVSVKTMKIGVVDAYIKVREQNMNVDIKCEEDWVKILLVGKDIIQKELSGLGYNVFFSVDKKETQASLTNCREFFEDSELGSINTRV